jgi:hypothetical protein
MFVLTDIRNFLQTQPRVLGLLLPGARLARCGNRHPSSWFSSSARPSSRLRSNNVAKALGHRRSLCSRLRCTAPCTSLDWAICGAWVRLSGREFVEHCTTYVFSLRWVAGRLSTGRPTG